MLLVQVTLHGQQENVKGSPEVLTILVSQNVEQVVENALEDGGPVQVPLARHEDLGLAGVPGDDPGRDQLPAAGVVVSFVEAEEVQRSVHPGAEAGDVRDNLMISIPLWS